MTSIFQSTQSRIYNSGAYRYVAPRLQNNPTFKEFAEVITGRANSAVSFVRANPLVAAIFPAALIVEYCFNHPGASRVLPFVGCCIGAATKEVVQNPSSILDPEKMGASIENGATNWMIGSAVLGISVMAILTAGCTSTPDSAPVQVPNNPAMCAIPGPDHTAILSFGPYYDAASHTYELAVPAGNPTPHLTDGVAGHIVSTYEKEPYDAIRGTVVCPIKNDGDTPYVCAACHPWGNNEADYFNNLTAAPPADANDSRAIVDVVNNVNAVAGYTNSVSLGSRAIEARASLFVYDNHIAHYLNPPIPS